VVPTPCRRAVHIETHEGCSACFRRLTFELSGRRRQDAKPGMVKMYEYHQPGLGGLPLVLRLSEGLGVSSHGAKLLR
jgi:hypothetical protein